jgi:hypothetical protein
MRRLLPPRLTVAVVLAFRRIESYGTTKRTPLVQLRQYPHSFSHPIGG